MTKFGNIKKHCLSRHLHDSKFEASYCDRLLAMKQAGEILDYQIQVLFPIHVNGQHICDHIVDFVVMKAKRSEIHETKGFRTQAWIIKRKLMAACYPEIPYIVINLKQRRPEWLKKKALNRRKILLRIRLSSRR